MSRYPLEDYVPGGTPAEAKILKNYKAVQVQKETKVPRWLYDNFMKGTIVPSFVREALEAYIAKKAKEIENGGK